MCLIDFERDYLAHLTTNWNIAYAGLVYCSGFQKSFWIESDLVVKDDDEFTLKPILYVLL